MSLRYSWCSEQLVQDKYRWSTRPCPEDLIPLETAAGKVRPFQGKWTQRLVIGHNVGFDRSYVKEQYYLQVRKRNLVSAVRNHKGIRL